MSLGYLVNSTVFTTNRIEERQSMICKEMSKEMSKEILLKNSQKSEKIDSNFISHSDILDKVNDSKKNFEAKKLNDEQTRETRKNIKPDANQIKSRNEKKKVVSSKLGKKNKNAVANVKSVKNVENDTNVNKKRILKGKITAYTASKSAKTARGNTPRVGGCAMNRKYLGRKVRLTVGNYSEDFIVDDTGGAFNRRGSDRILDIYMTDKKACYNWGVRSGYVEFLD